MASATRGQKPTRKGGDAARRPPGSSAWGGARASPSFSPSTNPSRLPPGPPANTPGSFPPLSQANGNRADTPQDNIIRSLSGLTGTTITLVTKTSQRFEGVVASTAAEGDTTGVTLKDVKDLSGAPAKPELFIAATNIDTWASGPADAKIPNGNVDSFRTDADISQQSGPRVERELQSWKPGPDVSNLPTNAGQGDDATFGPSTGGNTSWDQFAANERLFGVTTHFDEDLYTTKLDRSASNFKEREREAQRLANEINGGTSSNPHIAEERTMNTVDDSGMNEEDKYGAVVRSTGAYVPPGARRGNPATSGITSPTPVKTEIPKVSINGPDGATVPAESQTPPSDSKSSTPAPTSAASPNSNKPPADPLPAFRDFVTNEKQRLTQKRQALVKSEMDKRMAELVKFSQNFKLNKPIPDDLVPILAKDVEKQKLIRDKSSKDAASSQARSIGVSSTVGNGAPNVARATPLVQGAGTSKAGAPRPSIAAATSSSKPTSASNQQAKVNPSNKPGESVTKAPAAAAKPNSSMFIQVIPPFKGNKKAQPPTPGTSGTSNGTRAPPVGPASNNNPPMSPKTAAANRLNVNASLFRPNPKAGPSPNASNASTPSVSSPKPKSAEPAGPPNPFFGSKIIGKGPAVNIKDDFNPFKHNKVAEASTIGAMWPYTGKRYMQMFPLPQHQPQQHPSHMAPPGPPPMPPPSYEEDSAAQAAARGYVYTYQPYAYPGQPMMPGMGPPGPPGAYMPGPFMQPMPYPPGMPPPNGQPMYAPMGQMPPPGAYMSPPPPGQYPPPPNGVGQRPSFPPTPTPSHAHPYYHQSPQLQHAVPYPMMMPPQGQNGPPHPYESGPAAPVQMGGVGHS